MGNPSIQERLETVSALLPQREDLRDSLELYKRILQIQLKIEEIPTKGTKISLDDRIAVGLQRKSLKAKKPIIHFLDPLMFNIDVLFQVAEEFLHIFLEQNVKARASKRILDSIAKRELDLFKLVEATLTENIITIKKTAEKLDVQPPLLLHMASVLIQPCLEEIARKTAASLLHKWWQATCPVCGRIPFVARIRNQKRYLACTFCGTEYLSDRFLCVNCGNKDPYTLKYLVIEAQPALQIDYCTKCRHYTKVIDETRLKENIPKGLEDILTLNLDSVAKKADLVRN